MIRIALSVVAVALVSGGALGAAGLLAGRVPKPGGAAAPSPKPVWTEASWPFPTDPWGKGKAYRCKAEHCGTEVNLYLRAKIGSCGCVSAIDDDDLDRIGDVDLVGGERAALGPGRPIDVRWMKGRSRGYALGGRGATARSALAIAFHERCDMVVATAAIGGDRPAAQEDAVLEFLNSDPVLRWAEATLGL
jgi:hypothetical protein